MDPTSRRPDEMSAWADVVPRQVSLKRPCGPFLVLRLILDATPAQDRRLGEKPHGSAGDASAPHDLHVRATPGRWPEQTSLQDEEWRQEERSGL